VAAGQAPPNGDSGRPGGPGDLGRRVAVRRHEVGLTRKQLEDKAGMAPGYVEYLEQSPAEPSAGTVVRLAAALETTAADLLGAGQNIPPGRGRAAAHPVLEALSGEECARLLAPGGVGRLVTVDARGPVALPINFAVIDGDIVFRTAAASPVAATEGRQVGFEVDRLDEAMHEGWSVLVTGKARRVTDRGEVEEELRGRDVEPWAGGQRDVYFRLTPTETSGRRIRAT
jgi:nitroimidazol reductase NimA-like FMN-containing flavoprotein (pyridoxamine 5'-phosphate oxidase superfamily)